MKRGIMLMMVLLPAPEAPTKAIIFPGLCLQAEILQRGFQCIGILVPNVFEFNVALNAFDTLRAGILFKRNIIISKRHFGGRAHTGNRCRLSRQVYEWPAS